MRKSKDMSDEALRRYYDTHSSLGSGEKLRPVAMKFPKPRRLVGVRLEDETLSALRRIAERKGLNYSTLMRMWITERLSEENSRNG